MKPAPAPEYPEFYYEILERYVGPESAAWSRLPPEEREKQLTWIHENFNTPDDLAVWPPELGGDEANPPAGQPAGSGPAP